MRNKGLTPLEVRNALRHFCKYWVTCSLYHYFYRSVRTKFSVKLTSLTGLTFLEILAALLIMSIAFIPMMKLMTGGVERARGIDAITRSAFLAEGKMEEVRSLILGTDPSYGFSHNYTQSATAFPSPNGSFKYTVSDNAASNIKELNIDVWLDEDANSVFDDYEYGVTLDTKVADRG